MPRDEGEKHDFTGQVQQAARFTVPGVAPCEKCGGPKYVELRVRDGGWLTKDGYDHGATCPTLFCKHGVPFIVACEPCDVEPERCNRHDDCDAADEKAKAAGKLGAEHCYDSGCEECFGY